ncbi:MAG: DUF4249 domain-containing protein [Bacteroidaceae bacterium]|nr:DUF4249 domain-containing protein [Bacteroidaceae bacterium]
MKTKRYLKFLDKGASPLAILLMLFGVLVSACEKDVEFEGPAEEAANDIVINAVAFEGEPLAVYLNHAYPIGKQPVTQYIDFQHAMYYESNYLTDYRDDSYYRQAGIFDAEVTAVVNDGQTLNLKLDQEKNCYVCNYRPQANDHIVIKAKSPTAFNEATAETTVPAKPKIEVVKHEVLKDSSYYEVNQLISYADTIMRITCRISDAGGSQYYRLRIRGERSIIVETWYNPRYERPNEYESLLRMQDVYFSTDQLFVDARLNKNFGGWPAYFSNVFDNSLMQGKDYSFTLDSPKPSKHFSRSSAQGADGEVIFETRECGEEFPARVMVELQAISPALYRYLKSVELYRVSENDAFSEPIQIYSNVHHGWGIFGSLSSQRLIINYD